MRRLLMVFAAMAVMAAMVVATALPAFADKGGQPGHTTFSFQGGNCSTTTCTVTSTHSGSTGQPGSGGGGGGGRLTDTFTGNYSQGISQFDVHQTGGGGGPGGGSGGNCTGHIDLFNPNNDTFGGHGSAC